MTRQNLIIGGISVVVIAVILYFVLKPGGHTQDKDCFTVSYEKLNSELGTGMGDSNDPNYSQALMIVTDNSGPIRITIYPVGKDGKEDMSRPISVDISDPDRCKLPDNTEIGN